MLMQEYRLGLKWLKTIMLRLLFHKIQIENSPLIPRND